MNRTARGNMSRSPLGHVSVGMAVGYSGFALTFLISSWLP